MAENSDFTRLMQLALGCGFTHTGELKTETFKPRSEVRDACAEDKCKSYGKNWACPPACGNLEDCEKKIRRFKDGLILQTSGKLEDPFDYEEMQNIAGKHQKHLRNFLAALSSPPDDPALPREFLLLGGGACRTCEKCSYPDSPCLFPEKMIVSMEAMGLVVSDVCTANGLPYYHGPNTLTYVGCVLFNFD
jgi:predicted metal-binding protein